MSRRRKRKNLKPAVLDYEQIVRDVAQAQLATHHIPAVVAQEVNKAWKQLPNSDPKRGPKSWFHDLFSTLWGIKTGDSALLTKH